MPEQLSSLVPNVASQLPAFQNAIVETIVMLAWSGVFVFVFGLVLGVALVVTRKGNICACEPVFQVLDKVTSFFRSIPFIILLAALLPLSRLIMGTAIGVPGAIVPLVIGAVPFFARQVETSLTEVDPGLVEAARAMGLTPLDTIWRVYLRESIPSLARQTTVTLISLLNLTAMAGAVGAGGLGNFAIQYGKDRNQPDVIYVTVLVLVVMVGIIQAVGTAVATSAGKRASGGSAGGKAPHRGRIAAAVVAAVAVVAIVAAALSGNGSAGEKRVVKLGVTGTIYDQAWAPAKEQLAAEGIDLQIVQFSDYTTPNSALDTGEIDLNAFQHRIFLQGELDKKGYKIQNIGNTFVFPLHLYSKTVGSVDEIKDGDKVAIPDDVTNGGRALKVLEAAGLIKLRADAGFNPTLADIESYAKKIEIVQLAANNIPSILPDVAAGVVNGNYALDNDLQDQDIIFEDTSVDEKQYWNLIAARTDDLADPEKKETYRKVVEAFQSQGTLDVFQNTFNGFFVAEGWDEDLLG